LLIGITQAQTVSEQTDILRTLSAEGDLVSAHTGVWRLALLDPPRPTEQAAWQQALKALLTDHPQMVLRAMAPDRWDRKAGQIYRQSDGLWLQRAMVLQGVAVVRAVPDDDHSSPSTLKALLAAEEQARTARRGLWAHARQVEPATPNLSTNDGHLHLVQGTIHSVSEVRSVWYLNFGADWRKDFTVRLDRTQKAAWDQAGLPALDSLSGHEVRVRGWIRWANGPLIDLYSPFMMEFLKSPLPIPDNRAE
jgi:hypothetical protein